MTDDRTTNTRTVAEVLNAAQIACVHFIAEDGHPAIKVRGNDEAVRTVCAALGLDPDKPATATTQLEPHQHVVEITDDPAGDPVLADDGEGQYVVIVRSGGAG